MKYAKYLAIGLCAVAILLAGCTTKQADEGSLELKVGVMPAVDSAPMFVAEKKGYFEELGLKVDLQIYTNAMNRQSALQSKELDGAMTDVIALVNNVQNGFDIKVTTSTDGSFPILVSKDFTEKTDVRVGLMEVSVVNYLSDEYLGEKYNLEKVYINEIPARLEMISQGQIDMVVLPEPVASQGSLNGLEKRVYKNEDEFSPEVMVFTGDAIKNKQKALKLFHQAYNKAVADIQADDAIAREVLVERLELNPQVKDIIDLPEYHQARLPSEEYIQKIINWNEQVLGAKIDLQYDELVEGMFVQ